MQALPDPRKILRNGMQQFLAFLEVPHAAGWSQLATFLWFWPLQVLAETSVRFALQQLESALAAWRKGGGLAELEPPSTGASGSTTTGPVLTQDVLSYATVADVVSNRRHRTVVLARIGDSEAERTGSDFPERWRRFLAGLNLFQFIDGFRFWASSEVDAGTAPDFSIGVAVEIGLRVAGHLRTRPRSCCVRTFRNSRQPDCRFHRRSPRSSTSASISTTMPSPSSPGRNASPPWRCSRVTRSISPASGRTMAGRSSRPDELQAKGISYLIDQLTQGLKGAGTWLS